MKHWGGSLRADEGLYVLRCFQLIFGIITVAVAGDEISGWKSSLCSAPTRLNFNAAVAALILPLILYLLLTTGWAANKVRFLPWSAWLQLAIDLLFLALWLAAGAWVSESYSCDELCGICAPFGDSLGPYSNGVYTVLRQCTCLAGSPYYDYKKLRKLALRSSSSEGTAEAIGSLTKLSKKAKKLGLDWLMFIFFLLSFAWTAYSIYSDRKTSSNAPAGDTEANAPATALPTEPNPPTKQNQVVTEIPVQYVQAVATPQPQPVYDYPVPTGNHIGVPVQHYQATG